MGKIPKNTKINCVIYTLAHPDTGEIRYIGKTVKNLKHRLTDHLYSAKREVNYRANWIKSIVKLNKKPIIEFLDECPWNESQNLEIYWISQFKQWNFRLVNLSEGGEGCIGVKRSKEFGERLGKLNSKKVYQYSLKGEFLKEWKSCQAAGNSLNKNNSKIAACARGVRKKAYNYMWSYDKKKNLKEYRRKRGYKLSREHRNKAIKNLKGYGKYFK